MHPRTYIHTYVCMHMHLLAIAYNIAYQVFIIGKLLATRGIAMHDVGEQASDAPPPTTTQVPATSIS